MCNAVMIFLCLAVTAVNAVLAVKIVKLYKEEKRLEKSLSEDDDDE